MASDTRDSNVMQPFLSSDVEGQARTTCSVRHTPHQRAWRSRRKLPMLRDWGITLLGAALVAAAVMLKQSGLEQTDYKPLDDRCFRASEIVFNGLPVDACLSRDTPEIGKDCGGLAADAFCKVAGTNYLVNFTITKLDENKDMSLGAITLGNGFIGGRLTFGSVCCDDGTYHPAVSRWLLFAGGVLLLYSLSLALTKGLLWMVELAVVQLFDAGEALYFFIDLERPLRWLLWAVWLMSWIHMALYQIWCGPNIDCEDHGSSIRRNINRTAQCILSFSAAWVVSKVAPRVISARYFFKREFGKIKEMMQKEALLAALTQVGQQQQQQQQPAEAAAAADGAVRPGHGSRHRKHNRPAGVGNVMNNIAELQLGHLGAITAFQDFLVRYQVTEKSQLMREAEEEAEVLFSKLGGYDVNGDGTVGLKDFEELYKHVRLVGFSGNYEDAAELTWHIFDINYDNKISKEEVKEALQTLYNERINMALTVQSNDSAVHSLEGAIAFVLYTFIIFASLSIFDIPSSFGTGSLDFFTTYVLALSFIFGDTVQSAFRSTIYLFAEHPYNVGDLLLIDDVLWKVASFDLMYTVLYQWDVNSASKLPNDMLMDSQLINVSRGRAYKDSISTELPLAMPAALLDEMRRALRQAAAQRPKEFVAETCNLKVDGISNGQVMTVTAEWVYAFSPAERERIEDDREYMLGVMRGLMVDLGVCEVPLNLNFKLATAATGKVTADKKL